jgi:hypothetical protein
MVLVGMNLAGGRFAARGCGMVLAYGTELAYTPSSMQGEVLARFVRAQDSGRCGKAVK